LWEKFYLIFLSNFKGNHSRSARTGIGPLKVTLGLCQWLRDICAPLELKQFRCFLRAKSLAGANLNAGLAASKNMIAKTNTKTVETLLANPQLAAHLISVQQEMEGIIALEGYHDFPDLSPTVLSTGGKKLRALFPYLFGQIIGVKGPLVTAMGAICEIIHAATLLHDDVIDGAGFRRKQATANHTWGNKRVILYGDYLFSSALKRLVAINNIGLFNLVSETIRKLSIGEILQMQLERNLVCTEEQILTVIRLKTASLFTCSVASMGFVGGGEKYLPQLTAFGEAFGCFFQICDDLADYFVPESQSGKPRYSDFKNGIPTLPLVFLLKQLKDSDKKDLGQLFVNPLETQNGLMRVEDLMEKVKLREEMRVVILEPYREKCRQILSELPPCEAKNEVDQLLTSVELG
jgi:octaprenyl-diphosphate synthase